MYIKHYKEVLWGIFFFSFILFIISVIQIIQGNIGGLQPLLYGFGFLLYSAFNWADIFIFTILWMLNVVILLHIRQKEYFWVVFFSFWLIRSSGEVIFSFMQQFSPNYRPWLLYAPRAIMQNTYFGHFIFTKYWVVEQIFFQSISVLSLFGLIYTIVKLLKVK